MVFVNIDKAKLIAHKSRRAMRDVEFKPYDDIIAKQIPGKSATDAEAQRQLIRNKYAAMQTSIDASTTVDEIKAALAS